jgi:AcrR family transcriptional regulator
MVEAIVEAAARILETRGLAGFNTNAVAERAGVSVGSLYQYFPSKEALMSALSVRERGRLAADIEAAGRPRAGLSLEESLRRLVRAAIRRQLARPDLARVLDFEEQRLVLDASDRATTGTIAGEVATVLHAHRRSLRLADCEEAAFDLVALARALIDGAASRGRIEPAALEDKVMRAALGYLRRR